MPELVLYCASNTSDLTMTSIIEWRTLEEEAEVVEAEISEHCNICRELHCPLGEQDHVLHRVGLRSGHLVTGWTSSFSCKTAPV